MLDHSGSSPSYPNGRSISVPALEPYLIEPIWEQFRALLPERNVHHPLGCHRPRVPDRVVFEKLVAVLVFGCAYWRIAERGCSATTIRRRRDEWLEAGLMDTLEEIALESYDRMIGLELSDVSVDGCITKAPCGGNKSGRSPVDRGKRGVKRSTMVDARGIPLAVATAGPTATTRRFLVPPSTPPPRLRPSHCPSRPASTSTEPTTRGRPASFSKNGVSWA
jgi:transposase